MVLGVDFDNTIVCYDQVFHKVAFELDLIHKDLPENKSAVRNYLRQKGKEDDWTKLQGYIYGARMTDAPPFDGVLDFFFKCRENGIKTFIISHKTINPFLGPLYNLHDAANSWLEYNGFYDSQQIGLSPQQVFFELTKQEKLNRIRHVGCSHFIDDLPEFLAEPKFPESVKRFLFDPNNNYPANNQFQRIALWKEFEEVLINEK